MIRFRPSSAIEILPSRASQPRACITASLGSPTAVTSLVIVKGPLSVRARQTSPAVSPMRVIGAFWSAADMDVSWPSVASRMPERRRFAPLYRCGTGSLKYPTGCENHEKRAWFKSGSQPVDPACRAEPERLSEVSTRWGDRRPTPRPGPARQAGSTFCYLSTSRFEPGRKKGSDCCGGCSKPSPSPVKNRHSRYGSYIAILRRPITLDSRFVRQLPAPWLGSRGAGSARTSRLADSTRIGSICTQRAN